MKIWLVGLLGLLMAQAVPLRACIWDSDTLWSEKLKNPDLAKLILGATPPPPDPTPFLKRIQELKANPRRQDPHWWNDLAGAYIRAGKPQEAADLLAPVVSQFPDDYGIHANLGTAYHLLGRYAEAAKHIARDLEINPEAHFGLEKYHLALLQYLERDADYQSRHVYVDEYSPSLVVPGNFLRVEKELRDSLPADVEKQRAELKKELSEIPISSSGRVSLYPQLMGMLAELDPLPDYRNKWNLAQDEKFKEGVIYMATLNPQQPAVWVMVGMLCGLQGDLHLEAAAYERAIALGSPQKELLQIKIEGIHRHTRQARKIMWPVFGLLSLGVAAIGYHVYRRFYPRKFPA